LGRAPKLFRLKRLSIAIDRYYARTTTAKMASANVILSQMDSKVVTLLDSRGPEDGLPPDSMRGGYSAVLTR
jgi:hypothetical protein